MSPLAAYRLPGSGTGFALEWRAATYVSLAKALKDRVDAWDDRITSFNAVMTDYGALPGTATADERLQLLRTAETLVSTTVSSGLGVPAQLNIVNAARTAFGIRRADCDAAMGDGRCASATAASFRRD